MDKQGRIDLGPLDTLDKKRKNLDESTVSKTRLAFKDALPPPYDELLSLDAIEPSRSALEDLAAAIDTDPDLSPEEKHVLHFELSSRWHAVVVGQAGEGFNN